MACSCNVSIFLPTGQTEWQVLLQYADGRQYLSKKRYATEEEAEAAAYQWALENTELSEGRSH